MASLPGSKSSGSCQPIEYNHQMDLKYGCNPHQLPAYISTRTDMNMPFEVLNGKPGYINLCDALNAWQLVKELREALGEPSAASFKHVSPAGAAIPAPLTDELKQAYEAPEGLSKLALAYVRARNGDPKSSFGDFIALSDKVDLSTAMVIKSCVSDGVIAPDYEQEALEILSKKKGGRFCVLKANPDYEAPAEEHREIYGLRLSQRRNTFVATIENSIADNQVVTQNKSIPDSAKRDLIVAAIATKYTQSNSVCFALNGQVIGVGAGQQSRIDCVKLAQRKAEVWFLRQHPKVLALKFKPEAKRTTRTNGRIAYIEGGMTAVERRAWEANLEEVPEPLTQEEQTEFLKGLQGVSLFSDAFFPFRDNIDQASKVGVHYILQPGGSTRDADTIAACDEYGMAMAFNGTRSFHH